MAQINKNTNVDNPNYLGYDENHDGDWNDFYICPNCKENNYITIDYDYCSMCGVVIEWIA